MEKFNLLDEKWIGVIAKDGRQKELSLPEVFRQAPEILYLHNETPAMDTALLRMLLSFLYAALDQKCTVSGMRLADQGMDVWKELWQAGNFADAGIEAYCEKWADRFWLLSTTRPFLQALDLDWGEAKTTDKFNGLVDQSDNKTRLFAPRRNEESSLDLPEAARWLVYQHLFGDASAKPTKSLSEYYADGYMDHSKRYNWPCGWCMKTTQVFASGNSLFETLMYNLILEPEPESGVVYESFTAPWQVPHKPHLLYTNAEVPADPAAVSMLLSRVIRLIPDDDMEKVVGFRTQRDVFYDPREARVESHVCWRIVEETGPDKKKTEVLRPAQMPDCWIWQATEAFLDDGGGNLIAPGVAAWILRLRAEGVLDPQTVIGMDFTTALGDDKSMSLVQIQSTSPKMQAGVMAPDGKWIGILQENTRRLNGLMSAAMNLDLQISKLLLGREPRKEDLKPLRSASQAQTKERLADVLEPAYSHWLASLSDDADPAEKEEEWNRIVRRLARAYADWAETRLPLSCVFRECSTTVEKDGKKRTVQINAAEALGRFAAAAHYLFPLPEDSLKGEERKEMMEKRRRDLSPWDAALSPVRKTFKGREDLGQFIARTYSKLNYLQQRGGHEESVQKTFMSRLRGQAAAWPELSPSLHMELFETYEKEMGGRPEARREENAASLALVMMALHLQGRRIPDYEIMSKAGDMGWSIARLEAAKGGSSAAASSRRRMEALFATDDESSFAQELGKAVREMRTNHIPVNYMRLAQDTLDWQTPETKKKLALRWARSYHNAKNAGKEK